jgi:hypothetical protein
MTRWVYCHLCGCTGVHREPQTAKEYPCPNGCTGGRVYEDSDPEWFCRLVNNGARIQDEATSPKTGFATSR